MLLDSQGATQNQVLPNTSLVLALQYRGRVHNVRDGVLQDIPPAALTGISHAPRPVAHAKGDRSLFDWAKTNVLTTDALRGNAAGTAKLLETYQ
ncbi:hypothetical protein [Hymenobacter sp.]|uniref:hypothetical protein n=1 Tax=Hymenobacter sp. TaxID=1898978 RepID=UPI00286D1923|nr:hypothetical protein [Hymenobacter sp.]